MVRTLTTDELRLALLARQGLLEPFALPVPRVVERMAGIQSQYAPSAYVGLRSRCAGFERRDLTRALERRQVVQATLMRGTIHVVSRRDYWPLAAALREPRRRWWLRVSRSGKTPTEMAHAAERVRRVLADGPLRQRELVAAAELERVEWGGVGYWVDLVRVPPSGTWERRRADLFGLASSWVGPDPDADADAGLDLLVRRYLAGFGPATTGDIASFTQLPIGVLTPVLDRLDLRRFQDADGAGLLDVRRAPLPDLDTPPPRVTFLGEWDATLLVHARRTQLLPERHRDRVFHTRMPQSLGTFLLDGQVAGAWRVSGDGVSVEPFESLDRSATRDVRAAADELAAFVA